MEIFRGDTSAPLLNRKAIAKFDKSWGVWDGWAVGLVGSSSVLDHGSIHNLGQALALVKKWRCKSLIPAPWHGARRLPRVMGRERAQGVQLKLIYCGDGTKMFLQSPVRCQR
jgi:hypothetical protein